MANQRFEVFEFSVRGKGVFPTDMLRYDSAVPKTEKDATIISNSPWAEKEMVVALRRFYPVGGHEEPTIARWRSFGWEVLP